MSLTFLTFASICCNAVAGSILDRKSETGSTKSRQKFWKYLGSPKTNQAESGSLGSLGTGLEALKSKTRICCGSIHLGKQLSVPGGLTLRN